MQNLTTTDVELVAKFELLLSELLKRQLGDKAMEIVSAKLVEDQINTFMDSTKNAAKMKDQSQKLFELLGDGFRGMWVSVCQINGEKRVYVNDGEPNFGKGSQVACYYLTGNADNEPKSMTYNVMQYYGHNWHGGFSRYITDFKSLLHEIALSYDDAKFSLRKVLQY